MKHRGLRFLSILVILTMALSLFGCSITASDIQLGNISIDRDGNVTATLTISNIDRNNLLSSSGNGLTKIEIYYAYTDTAKQNLESCANSNPSPMIPNMSDNAYDGVYSYSVTADENNAFKQGTDTTYSKTLTFQMDSAAVDNEIYFMVYLYGTDYGSGYVSSGGATSAIFKYTWIIHDHDFTYTADGDTITAECNGRGDCDITDGLTMTISADDADYDGEAHGAALSTDYNTTAFPGEYEIEYYLGDTKLDGAPVNPGVYTAKVTVGDATASVEYSINGHVVVPIDLEDCDVTVDTDNKTVTVTFDGEAVPESEYTVIFFAYEETETGESMTQLGSEFPTEPGTYIAGVVANEDSMGYIGEKRSEPFTIEEETESSETESSETESSETESSEADSSTADSSKTDSSSTASTSSAAATSASTTTNPETGAAAVGMSALALAAAAFVTAKKKK